MGLIELQGFLPEQRSHTRPFVGCLKFLIQEFLLKIVILFFFSDLSLNDGKSSQHFLMLALNNHSYPVISRSSRPDMFCKKGVVRNFAKFIKNTFFHRTPLVAASVYLWSYCFVYIILFTLKNI